ncbi:hypothetical protein HMN09_00289400 [Mycena chlorophos]|uniref:Uncharacterized protein n=1 Tax=Mycena chlorophos TaxID=658473 RepID=A0A8H6TLY3_MYCCL|nr:hypothetical protein HMN09_00289400 [Mycena chlorophos]
MHHDPAIEIFVCCPKLYCEAGQENMTQDDKAPYNFLVVLQGASPGAYTNEELARAHSKEQPAFCVSAENWHDVLYVWAQQCFHKHLHSRQMTDDLRWMVVRLGKPLARPPSPRPASPVSISSPDGRNPIFEVILPSNASSPASFTAVEIGSDVASFVASPRVTWRTHYPDGYSPPRAISPLPDGYDLPSLAAPASGAFDGAGNDGTHLWNGAAPAEAEHSTAFDANRVDVQNATATAGGAAELGLATDHFEVTVSQNFGTWEEAMAYLTRVGPVASSKIARVRS